MGGSVWDYLHLILQWANAIGVICTSYCCGRTQLGLFAPHVAVGGCNWDYLHLVSGWADATGIIRTNGERLSPTFVQVFQCILSSQLT